MLIRILGEGQYVLPESALAELNRLDAALEAALKTAEPDVTPALDALLEFVRSVGVRPPDHESRESDVILPFADASEDDIRACSPRKASCRTDPLDRAPPSGSRSGGGASSSAGR